MTGVFTRLKREWSISDVAKLVRSHDRFKMLSEADALFFVQHMHPLRLDAGGTVFKEGRTDANFMAIILEGEAKAETESLGPRVRLSNFKPGDLIGEQGILHAMPRSATVTATTDMVLSAIDGAKFDKLIQAKPALGNTLLMSMLRMVTLRLAESNTRMQRLEHNNAKLTRELELVAPKLKPELKEIPPLQYNEEMFQPPEPPKRL